MNKLLLVIAFMICYIASSSAQMPPPGYERAIKIEEARQRMPPMERDSITLIDTSTVFDPATYEEEVLITQIRISIKDYCTEYLGISKPEMLMDGKPHSIIDPRTYEEIIIRMNSAGKIDTIPN